MHVRRSTGLRKANAFDTGFEPIVGARHIDLIDAQPRRVGSCGEQLPPIIAHEIKAERIPIRHQVVDLVEAIKLNASLIQLERDLVHVRPDGGAVFVRQPDFGCRVWIEGSRRHVAVLLAP
jgi:hypothetical protein